MAYRILIADDELVERTALKLFISREFPGLEICGEASNGIEFLDIVNNEHPDIAIVDINMPALGGLEAIRVIRIKENQLKCIIHTAYSEFDFAQQALQLGVISYLLKPVNKKNLHLIINKIIETLDLERSKQKLENLNEVILKEAENSIEEEIIDSIYLNIISKEYINSYLLKQDENYNGFIIISIINYNEDEPMDVTNIRSKIKTIIPSITGKFVNDSIVAIILIPNTQTKIVQNRWITTICQEIQNDIGDMQTLNFGASCYFNDIHNLYIAFTQSQEALLTASDSSRIQFYPGNPDYKENIDTQIYGLAEKIRESLLGPDKAYHLELIEKIIFKYNLTVNHNVSALKEFALSLYIQIENTISDDKHFSSLKSLVSLKNTNSKNEIVDWFRMQIRLLLKQYQERRCSNINISIEESLDCIHNEFHKNISLDYIADKIGLSSYYLSHLFKKETGKTYIQYLTDYRIKEAGKLIKTKRLSLAEVAYKCGYSNSHYFGKVYYKTMGIHITNINGICMEK